MSILYLVSAPAPPMEGTDAVFQEVGALRDAFGGKIINLFPLARPTSLAPPQLYGWSKLAELRRLERDVKFNHLFYAAPYRLPVLRALRKPVVLTVTGSIKASAQPKNLAALNQLYRIVVSNERDAAILSAWGLSNYTIIPPGIDVSRFAPEELSLGSTLTLLTASAPWVERQFDLKGIDALLAIAAQRVDLKLMLLWRGRLVDALAARITRFGIAERAEIVNRKVDIREYLARAHATVLLAKSGDIVTSFPHSLLESLMGGKPVILSGTIAMADLVRRYDVGVVVDGVNVRSLAAAVETLRRRYDELVRNAARFPRERFSTASMIDNYRQLYGL
jgi:glycosyltransferase involved in cell wall biosynthesis